MPVVKLLIALCLLCLPQLVAANPFRRTLHKDLKRDFWAVGDGRHDDQEAFRRAAWFFNHRALSSSDQQPAVLHIPAGTYRVGRGGSVSSLLVLQGCRRLRIEGADSARTIIRYADSLRFGTFDPATNQPYEAPSAWFVDTRWGQALSSAIILRDCEEVEVRNLTLDGNSERFVVGGHWGDTGIQLGHDGLLLLNARRIRLRALAVHHFGRDGIQVLSHLGKSLDDPARENVLLENSRFDYNGRQGLSITGANGLRAVNCSFSHTGRVMMPATGRPLFSNPGAGVDIEPEGGYVANVRFERCRLVDNAGQALVSDRYGNGPPTTKSIVLHDCLLWGTTNWSAWVRQTDFLFENCRIYGAFVTGCALVEYATRFVGCTFEDRAYHGQPAYGQFLLYSNHEARAMSFTNCRFVGTRNYLLFAAPVDSVAASRFQLYGCTFERDNAEPPLGASNVLTNAVFSGRTVFQNGPHCADSIRTDFLLGSLAAPGSAAQQAGSHLLLAAPGSRYVLQNGLTIGPTASKGAASLEVGSGNELVLREQPGHTPELYIGPTSRLVVRRGGRLVLQPHTKVTVAGQLVVEEGGYFVRDAQAQVQAVEHGHIKASPPALRPQVPTKPVRLVE